MRHWLLTCTTYGTWLPGNSRGSVTSVRDRRAGDRETRSRLEHDQPGQPWEDSMPGLAHSAAALLKSPPIYLNLAHAEVLLSQFQETADYRERTLHALAIMHDHWHLVVTVPGDPDPEWILSDFKTYGTRALNREFGRPASKTWWTMRGSKRKLPTPQALSNAIHYVLYKQPHPLIVWSPNHGRLT